ncbi:YSC84-related protein [Flavobacteriaceae bacterium MJ-SS4]|uniref:lipid-binding SYLF domain-containing protein n=1 Tax=Gilvirhabdus luticola TaxID=3079858 RepID=UPI0032DCFD67
MKTQTIRAFVLLFLIAGFTLSAQTEKKKDEIIKDADDAKQEFLKMDYQMKKHFANSYGYAIFPNVGKGAIGVGGAAGNGVVYEQGEKIGLAKLKQLSIGFQWGGQAYREIIFFETKADLERFKKDKVELAAQASAVAVTAGASADAKYQDGVMIFTMQKGGLMYEASVGGQSFKFKKL